MSDLTGEGLNTRVKELEVRMEKSLEALHKELGTIRTGRASSALVEKVQVDYYGTQTPLQSLAGITVPEARLLVIQPYDKSSVGDIEKALQKADLGLNPSNDGTTIRIAIPPLTEERRKDFVKLVKQKAEEARVSIRNLRRDAVEQLRKLKDDGVSSDQIEHGIELVQKTTDKYVAVIDEVSSHKEAEILEV